MSETASGPIRSMVEGTPLQRCPHGHATERRLVDWSDGEHATWAREVCSEACRVGGWESAVYRVRKP